MRRDLVAVTTCVVVAMGGGDLAEAAPARVQFRVAPKAYTEALLDLAQQANVTLIGAGACAGQSRGVVGVLTVEEALDKVLAGAPCTARLVAAGTVEVAPILRAEPQRAPTTVTVSELLVTATRRVRDPRQLAVAVTAIPREQLLSTGAADAGDAAGQLAGVLATNLGPGRNKLLLRGLSDGAYTGRARSIVATFLDDIPVNYNAPDPDLRLTDVERVEVARGPQGALYGAGSLSGVYRIVTRKPDLDGFHTEVRGTGALTESGDPSYAVEGYVNYPLRLFGQTIGLRLAAYQEEQGGYLNNTRLGIDDVDRTERRGARLTALYEPTDNLSINLTVAGQHLRSDDTHYTLPGLGLKRDTRFREPHVNDIELATATVRRSWGWAELTSSTGVVRHRYGSLIDSTASKDLYTQFAETAVYSERTRTIMLVEDLVLTSRGAGRFEWLAGLYGSYTRVHAPTEFSAKVSFTPLLIPVYSDDRRDRIAEVAAYGEVSYEFLPGWTVAVGGRAFTIQTRTRSSVVSEKFQPRSFDREVAFSGFSPKLSIQTTFGQGALAYAVVTEGYRSGGINSGGAVPLLPERERFAPDRLTNFEVGVKLQAFERRLAVNAALFYDLWDDIQTDQFRDSGIPYTTNAGDAQVIGIETELAYRTDFGLTAQVNGRVTRTRTGRPNPAFIRTPLADGLPGAPPVSGGVILTYDRDLGAKWRLRLTGQAAYVGRSRVSFEAAERRSQDYSRAKLTAELTNGDLDVQLFLVNPFNSYNDTFAFGNPFTQNQAKIRQVTPQRPRTVGVTISRALW